MGIVLPRMAETSRSLFSFPVTKVIGFVSLVLVDMSLTLDGLALRASLTAKMDGSAALSITEGEKSGDKIFSTVLSNSLCASEDVQFQSLQHKLLLQWYSHQMEFFRIVANSIDL